MLMKKNYFRFYSVGQISDSKWCKIIWIYENKYSKNFNHIFCSLILRGYILHVFTHKTIFFSITLKNESLKKLKKRVTDLQCSNNQKNILTWKNTKNTKFKKSSLSKTFKKFDLKNARFRLLFVSFTLSVIY